MFWKIYFLSRAENGMPASKHYKVQTNSPAHALSHCINHTERKYSIHLIRIWDASVEMVTQEEWDADDGYEKLEMF
jgi:hypothetical protein